MTSPGALIPLAQAQARLLALAKISSPVSLPLAQASGHVLAQPLVATRNQPAADLSAMDGYAMCWRDMPGPWRIIGESAAGQPFTGTLGAGQAVRISTGALVPDGADAILVQEDCQRDGDQLARSGDGPASQGAHIRRKGHDFSSDAVLAEAGTRIDARLIALAAMAGHGTLCVQRPVRVAILSTGDELVQPGETLPTLAHIPASNGVMLAAMLSGLPVELQLPQMLPDRLDAIGAALTHHRSADIIVTTGGASVGDHDLVQPALREQGGKVDFWRIAMRPGKPVMVATLGDAIVLGLPGNPVSAYVTALLLLLPLVRKLAGIGDVFPSACDGIAGAHFPANGARQDFVRARFADGALVPVDNQDSGALRGLLAADALLIRAPYQEAKRPGDTVRYIPLNDGA